MVMASLIQQMHSLSIKMKALIPMVTELVTMLTRTTMVTAS